jgi:hypothetical protein
LLSNNEMLLLQQHANHALIDTCNIIRRTRVDDDAGGYTTIETVIGTNIICRITPVRNDFEQERVIVAGIGADISWILSLPVGTDIALTDVVEKDGRRLEVNAILAEPRSILTVIRVVISEVR